MDDSASQYDNDDPSGVKDEPEIYIATYEHNNSANCSFENMDESINGNSRRRSKRTRNRNTRYKSDDDDDVITLSPEPPRHNERNSDKDFEPSSTSARLSFTKINVNNNIIKKPDNPGGDPLARALKQIKLYDELYVLMKTRGITYEALKNMQPRHIDELFKGTRLGTKIIFEARLKEWQNKNCDYEVTTQSTCNNVNSPGDRILSEKLNSSISQVLHETDITNLANLLTNAVQKTINAVLQDFKQSFQQEPKDKPNNQVPIAIIPLKKIKVEPNCSANETIIPDKMPNKIVRSSSKLLKIPDDVSPSNQLSDRTISPQLKRRKVDDNISVKEILLSTSIGQKLFDEYDDNGLLTANQRTDIVRYIVDYYLRNNLTISSSQCREIAEEIVELFPTESLETYYVHDNKHLPPKGKIWDRYQVRKRSIRKMNASNSRLENDTLQNDIVDTNNVAKTDWSDMQAMCSQLKQIKNEKELFDKWKDSFAYRRHQLQTGYFSNWKLYFDEYPFCKQQNYAQFIEWDLETLYPDLKFNEHLWNEFIENFPTYFSNRIKHPKSKHIYDQLIAMGNLSSSNDYVAIKVIELLHAILRPNTNKLQSIEEAQRMFTVEVNDLSDLKKVVIERKKHCTENNIQAKPYIAVVGQNKVYSHFSVILDSTGFSCDNYKDSLILCFNLYLFFDISFPHESLNVWTFIQKYFFNKPPLVRNPRVDTFIYDIKGDKTASLDMKADMNGTI